jgi:multiple sugar transport system substrate-binding protein
MKKIYLLFLIFVLLLTSGFGCAGASTEAVKAMEPITLEYWRVYDGPDAFEEVIANYNKLHSYVTINYKKLRYSEYEAELVNALAEDRGPDIFSIHNTWVRKYQKKIAPMPDTITMVYPVTQGTIQKTIVPELRTSKSISLKDVKNNFADVVYDDVVVPTPDPKDPKIIVNKLYGLPLSVDTLAMYYNKDLLNNAGITNPPKYWNDEFQNDVKKLVKQDSRGKLVQAAIDMGGSGNIERPTDILSVLMMQSGAQMLNDAGQVTFDQIPLNYRDQNYNPGLEALRFYTDFANPAKEVYTWNTDLDNSLDMFVQGRLAFMLGYNYDLPAIRALAPKLNFGIAKLPQIYGNSMLVNFANYWVETVSAKSKNQQAAWDFVQYLTSAPQAKIYLDNTKKPTALRALVGDQIDNMDVGVFADQVLTTKSWYKGIDAVAAEKALSEMIDNVVAGQGKIEDIIKLGADKVQQTIGN